MRQEEVRQGKGIQRKILAGLGKSQSRAKLYYYPINCHHLLSVKQRTQLNPLHFPTDYITISKGG